MQLKFVIGQHELTKFNAWAATHKPNTSTNSQYSFTFTPTAIGVVVKATNEITGSTLDLTDYSSW